MHYIGPSQKEGGKFIFIKYTNRAVMGVPEHYQVSATCACSRCLLIKYAKEPTMPNVTI